MDYITAVQFGKDTILTGVSHFDLAQTLDNGQAFRWSRCEAENETTAVTYTGIAHGRRLDLTFADSALILKNVPLDEFESTWKIYFDFSRSYAQLRNHLSENAAMTQALEFSPGLRLMRQDPWETLISFILSQNSNIPRIKKMISALCENFGKTLPCGGHAFPPPEILATLTPSDLDPIKSGYRAAYVIDAARRATDGSVNPYTLCEKTSDEIHAALLQIHGVGPKVAECVLLYGFGRIERFPLDIWMKRVMSALYPHGFPNEILPYSGIAQQFLFHYARTNKLF
ncbi:MAG: DNA-3-methyladenine glycosylase 2 family protein [Defluviitaleaceae bacterium]|nr:DNA-3-methyladenine glycosylase 2 family protein [Defluviitaleaceae bacterium]